MHEEPIVKDHSTQVQVNFTNIVPHKNVHHQDQGGKPGGHFLHN